MPEKNIKISEMPDFTRPREKLIEKGPEGLRDSELLAILLGTGIEGKNVLEIARSILAKHKPSHLLKLNFNDLSKITGIGPAKACIILASQELVRRGLDAGNKTLPVIKSTADVIAQTVYMREKEREHFMAIYLNGRGEMIYKKPMFVGTLNANLVHPREIFRLALEKNAASVILAHNHPSGDPEPSQDDLMITKRLIEAGKIMGIEVLDHVIITKTAVFSFKEKRLI